MTASWRVEKGKELAPDRLSRSMGTHPDNSVGFQGLFFDRVGEPGTVAAFEPGARGLYNARNRSYNPRVGRFNQRDPNATGLRILTPSLGHRGSWAGLDISEIYRSGLNLYEFVNSNPTNERDPLGLFSLAEGLVANGILAGLVGMGIDSIGIATNAIQNDLGSGQISLLFVTSFFTNTLSALGPGGTAGGAAIQGILNKFIEKWEFSLSGSDIANVISNTAFGVLSGKVAGLRGNLVDWPDGVTSAAAAELSSAVNTAWSWVTPF